MNKPNLRLDPFEAPGEGLRRIALEQVDAACAALKNGTNPALAVHEARKSLKKLRAAFRLAAGALGARRREEEKAALRETARLLGPLRDAEVRLRTIDTLIQTAPAEPVEFGAVRAVFKDGQERVEGESVATIREVLKRLKAARGRVAHWPLASLTLGGLKTEVRRTYAKGRRALKGYRNQPGPEAFHEWRKRVKELWYELRILRAAFDAPTVGKRIKRLKKMGELAGDAHDLDTLRTSVRQLASPGVQAALMVGEIDARLPEFYAEALRRGEQFYKEKPGAFMETLKGK